MITLTSEQIKEMSERDTTNIRVKTQCRVVFQLMDGDEVIFESVHEDLTRELYRFITGKKWNGETARKFQQPPHEFYYNR